VSNLRQIQRITMGDFVGSLQAIPEAEFTKERVLRLMSCLLLTEDSLAPYVHRHPEHYTRNLVFRNDLFEILVVCWGVGQKTPIHNHDNQLGWLTLQRGMLSVQNYRRVACMHGGPQEDPPSCRGGSPAPVKLEEVSRIAISSVGAVTTTDPDDTIHEIGNLEAFAEPAVSVHVYSRPIDSCVVFDPEDQSCQRVTLSYYSEHGKVVAPA
jgi:cysteine dioxygenase